MALCDLFRAWQFIPYNWLCWADRSKIFAAPLSNEEKNIRNPHGKKNCFLKAWAYLTLKNSCEPMDVRKTLINPLLTIHKSWKNTCMNSEVLGLKIGRNDQFGKANLRSDRSNREKRSTPERWTVLFDPFRLERTDLFSFRSRLSEILIEWIVPPKLVPTYKWTFIKAPEREKSAGNFPSLYHGSS